VSIVAGSEQPQESLITHGVASLRRACAWMRAKTWTFASIALVDALALLIAGAPSSTLHVELGTSNTIYNPQVISILNPSRPAALPALTGRGARSRRDTHRPGAGHAPGTPAGVLRHLVAAAPDARRMLRALAAVSRSRHGCGSLLALRTAANHVLRLPLLCPLTPALRPPQSERHRHDLSLAI
jgi:hypothetical protein